MTRNYPISGLYEVCIGVQTSAEEVAVEEYFHQFGFGPAIPSDTSLTAAESAEQYGHASALSSVRLSHTDSDHGLIRIWKWNKLKNDGAPIGPLKAKGRRWGTMLTTDILNVANHARFAQSLDDDVHTVAFNPDTGTKKVASKNMYTVQPVGFTFFDTDSSNITPFMEKLPTLHEMLVVQNHSTQVLYQRHDVSLKHYGKVNHAARFPSSQFNHCGLVTTGDGSELDFYEEVLGLVPRLNSESAYDESTYAILDTKKEDADRVFVKAFDEPRSGTSWAEARSGRLYTIRWDPGHGLPDVSGVSNPGGRGMTGYTYRVRGVEEFRKRVLQSAATQVSEILQNEFRERAFSFVAPDGYWWQLIEWVD